METTEMQDRLRKSLQIIKTLQEQLAEKRTGERVSILGAAFSLPGGISSYDGLWDFLERKRHAITPFPTDRAALLDLALRETEHVQGGFIEAIDQFDPAFFHIGLEEAKAMDPQHRILLELVWRAFEDANIPMDELRGRRVGVYMALSNNDYSQQRFRNSDEKSPYDFTGNILATAAGRISYTFDFRGPAMIVDTACSSALVAMDQAFHALNEGRCDLAVVGGVNLILDPGINQLLRKIEATSPDGLCRPLDASANGYTRSEGGAAFVLKRSSDLDKDWEKPICEIMGSAVNHDGRSNGFTAPNGKAQEAVIKDALRSAGIRPEDIDLIELHGTGTKLGDPIEVEAIRQVFTRERRSRSLLLGSVKSNLGHLECAAGFAGLIKVMVSLQHRALPPTANIAQLNPLIQWHDDLEVPLETSSLDDRERIIAGISSFGISGTNAHLVVTSVSEVEGAPKDNSVLPLLLSASSEDRLFELLDDMQRFLETTDQAWQDICAAAAVGRKHGPYRASIMARSVEEAMDRLGADQVAFSPNIKKDQGRPKERGQQVHQAERQAEDLQRDYLAGKEIVWKGRFPSLSQRTTIPGAPFSRRHCWVRKRPVVEQGPVPGEVLTHPFLHRVFQSPGDPQTYHFTGNIDLRIHGWLEGHRLFDQVVFPGAGIHELAAAVGLSLFKDSVQVDDLRIIDPVYLEENTAIWVELRKDDAGYSGILYTRTSGKDWVRNALFHVSATGSIPSSPMPSVEGATLDTARFYAQCRAIGIDYTDRFAQLQEVVQAPRSLRGKIGGVPADREFLIGPDVLDNGFQVFGVWLMERFGAKAFVPTGTRSFRFYRSPEGPIEVLVDLPDRPENTGKITASFSIYGSNGLCAELLDFSIMPVDRDKFPGSANPLREHLYEIVWEAEAIGNSRTSTIRMPEFRSADLEPERLERSARSLAGLNDLADHYVAHIFHALGLHRSTNTGKTLAAWMEEFHVSDKHARLFERLMRIGVDNLWMTEADGRFGTVSIPEPDLDRAIAGFKDTYPHALREWQLLHDCAVSVPDVLTGRKDPLEILFPGGSTETLSAFYNSDPFVIMYQLCSDSFRQWLVENGTDRKIRILEVGAGTGSTTRQLLPLLRGHAVDYVFTDISPLFLSMAREDLKEYPFVTYRLLNIEEESTGQGFEPGSFDLIIASNVLHATKDLQHTFGNVSGLLKENGVLLMVEGNVPFKWIDLIFGLTSGWWLYTDTDLRPHHATLSVEKWGEFLAKTGFAAPQFLEPFHEGRSATGQSVVWARKMGGPKTTGSQAEGTPGEGQAQAVVAQVSNAQSAPHVIRIDHLEELETIADHTRHLLALIDKLRVVASSDPGNRRLFIFYGSSTHRQVIGFWRVLQNEWSDWDVNLVLADTITSDLIEGEIASASKGDCSRWKGSQREVLRLRRSALKKERAIDLKGRKVVVTGASGGLGQALIGWLLEKGVGSVVGVSRSKGSVGSTDARVQYRCVDLLDWNPGSDMDDVYAIFHLAGALDNQVVLNHHAGSIEKVLRPKIDGAGKIRQWARQHAITHVVHFASSASWLGTVGQANHAYANFDLTGNERSLSWNEVSILWGAWDAPGAVSKYDAESWVTRIGMTGIPAREGLDLMERIMGSGAHEIGVFELDWSKYRIGMKGTPFIQAFATSTEEVGSGQPETAPLVSFADIDDVTRWLESELSYTLGYESRQSFDHDAGFFDLGLDSLTTLDLVKRMEKRTGTPWPATLLFKYPTIRHLAEFIHAQFGKAADPGEDTPDAMEGDEDAMRFIDDQFNEMIHGN